jgi:hypothetical protein
MTTDVGPFDFNASYRFSFLVQFHQNLFILRYKEEIISFIIGVHQKHNTPILMPLKRDNFYHSLNYQSE